RGSGEDRNCRGPNRSRVPFPVPKRPPFARGMYVRNISPFMTAPAPGRSGKQLRKANKTRKHALRQGNRRYVRHIKNPCWKEGRVLTSCRTRNELPASTVVTVARLTPDEE